MGEIYANNAAGKLATAITDTDTTLDLEPEHNLPALGTDEWFRLTLYRWEFWGEGVREYDHEVVKVTDVSGDTLTVERALEGTAQAFEAGTNAELRPTAQAFDKIREDASSEASAAETAANGYTDDHAAKTGGAHGVPIGEEVEWQSQAQSRADAAETAAKAHADSALSDHESATDPHSQYTTTQQAADAAPVQSVHGRTGTVTAETGDYTPAQVGADPEGSADAAKTAAKSYTDDHATETGGIHGIPEGERALHTGEGGGVPVGAILMWSGSIDSIPDGWALCNGNNGTPDLRDRFVVGAGDSYSVDATGGSKDAVVVSHSHSGSTSNDGYHGHSGSTNTTGSHSHSIARNASGYQSENINHVKIDSELGTEKNYATGYIGSNGNHSHSLSINGNGSHSHSISIDSTGESGTDKNLPPYYALAYIMKL